VDFWGKKREIEQNSGFLRKPQINTDFLPQITQIFAHRLTQIFILWVFGGEAKKIIPQRRQGAKRR